MAAVVRKGEPESGTVILKINRHALLLLAFLLELVYARPSLASSSREAAAPANSRDDDNEDEDDDEGC